MSVPLSTEARIFASRLRREVKRREAVGAKALGGKSTWPDATSMALDTFMDAPGPVKAVKVMKQAMARLVAVSKEDQSFTFPPGTNGVLGSRQAILTLYTVEHENHPISHKETGIVVRRHVYHNARKMGYGRIMDELAFISDHTLGRLYERSDDESWIEPRRVFGLTSLLAMVGEIGYSMAHAHPEKVASQLNLAVEGYLLTGSMRHIRKEDASGATYFQPFFDVRTTLPEGAGTYKQREQALAITAIVRACMDQEMSVITVLEKNPDLMDMVPYIERRDDYITKEHFTYQIDPASVGPHYNTKDTK
jgi:hypothetical protein